MSEADFIASEPCILLPDSTPAKPLGNILQEADLISASQIDVALKDQNFNGELRIGEILALRGWLKQETADFFAQKWPELLQKQQHMPLGHYLKAAGLLDEEQISLLLNEQKQIGLRLGALAVLKGWLKPSTLEFFLKYICPERQSEAPFMERDRDDKASSKPERTAKEIALEDTLTDERAEQDTVIENDLERETIIEEFADEESFEDYETIGEDMPTQIDLSSFNRAMQANLNAFATCGFITWHTNVALAS